MNKFVDFHSLLPIVEAIQAETGRRVHVSTAIRWKTRGCRGVKLDAVRLGGRWFCQRKSVRDFVDRTNETGEQKTDPPPTPRQKELAANRAAKRLAERVGTNGL